MCKFQVGQSVNLTGRLFCKSCGQVTRQGGTCAVFSGHDNGFDVFNLKTPVVCPWCETINEAAEMPCSEPIVWQVSAHHCLQPNADTAQTGEVK